LLAGFILLPWQSRRHLRRRLRARLARLPSGEQLALLAPLGKDSDDDVQALVKPLLPQLPLKCTALTPAIATSDPIGRKRELLPAPEERNSE
jgi:hypothetical protein